MCTGHNGIDFFGWLFFYMQAEGLTLRNNDEVILYASFIHHFVLLLLLVAVPVSNTLATFQR